MNNLSIGNLLAFIVILLIISFSIAYIYWTHVTEPVILRVSTTTSLYATGLLDVLADDFKKDHSNVVIQFIAVGSGEALRKASLGDADIVLVHAPSLEKQYLNKNVIGEQKIFAYNYFVILGPKNDPARIKGLDPIKAMHKIYESCENGKAKFVSRSDNSGTNIRELMLWNKSNLNPKGKPWYIETGSGMSETLMVANEYEAYTISDIGTYLKFKDKLKELEILVYKGDILANIYSAYLVNLSSNKDIAQEFLKYLTSSRAQKIIGSYGLKEFGQPLFYPATSLNTSKLQEMWKKLAIGNV